MLIVITVLYTTYCLESFIIIIGQFTFFPENRTSLVVFLYSLLLPLQVYTFTMHCTMYKNVVGKIDIRKWLRFENNFRVNSS
jgi:hypothetical protein